MITKKPGKGLYFFGPDMPDGLSADERAQLLEKESQLAAERDEAARAYQAEQETARLAREDAQRLMTEAQERERVATLEAMEREGAEVAEGLLDEQDTDTAVSDMFAALAFGTQEPVNPDEAPEERPE